MNKTVLIVDDSKLSRMMLVSLLKQLDSSWLVLEAEDGEQAVGLGLARQPDLVIMDVNMPKMGGLEAGAILKQELKEATVMLLTGTQDSDTQQQADLLSIELWEKPLSGELVKKILVSWQKQHR